MPVELAPGSPLTGAVGIEPNLTAQDATLGPRPKATSGLSEKRAVDCTPLPPFAASLCRSGDSSLHLYSYHSEESCTQRGT